MGLSDGSFITIVLGVLFECCQVHCYKRETIVLWLLLEVEREPLKVCRMAYVTYIR